MVEVTAARIELGLKIEKSAVGGGDVVAVVEDGRHLGLGRSHGVRRGGLHRDAADVAVAREGVLHRRQRGDDPVVLVLRAAAALGPEEPDDLERHPVELHRLPDDRAAVPADERGRDGRAEQRHPVAGGVVGVGERGPGRHGVVVVDQVARRRAGEGGDGVRGAVVGRRHRRRADDRCHGDDVRGERRVHERLGVVQGQLRRPGAGAVVDGAGAAVPAAARRRTDPPRRGLRPAEPRLPRSRRPPPPPPTTGPTARAGGDGGDREGVAAERADRLLDGGARPGARGDQDDHRRDADDDPDIVSSERSLFASTPRTANRALSRMFTTSPPPRRRGVAAVARADRPRARRTGRARRASARTRFACSATSSSWVITTSVRPAEFRSSNSSSTLRGAGAVERAGGLVGQQQHRIRDDRPRDRDPLLLAARQLRRAVARPGAETDQLQRGQRPLPALRGPDPGIGHRQLDVADARTCAG